MDPIEAEMVGATGIMEQGEAAAPTEVVVDALPSEAPPIEEDEAALITRFEREMKVPSWLTDSFERMRDDEDYVENEAFADQEDYQVGANFVLRAIYAKHAQIFPSDPGFNVLPDRLVNQRLLQNPMAKAFVQQAIDDRAAFADTCAALVTALFRSEGGVDIFQQGSFDAFVRGIAWVKVSWSEDPTRDPLGQPLQSDGRDQIARLRRLASEFAAGEWPAEDARHREMVDLTETVALQAKESLAVMGQGDPRSARLQPVAGYAGQGVPLPPHLVPEPSQWMGPVFTLVDPRNLRWDWGRIRSLKQFRRGRHMTEVAFMTTDEVVERWGLSLEDRQTLGRKRTQQDRDPSHGRTVRDQATEPVDPSSTDLEATTRGADEVAVYERYDREAMRRYIWVDGMDRFVVNEPYTISTRHQFPYIPIGYNWLTNRALPISDVRIVQRLQDEINTRLSDAKAARRARYPKFVVEPGLFQDGEMEKLQSAEPHEVITLQRAADIAKAIHPVMGTPFEPSTYDYSDLLRLIEMQMGLPVQATGLTGSARLATEVNVANDHMLAQSGRHGAMLTQAMIEAAEMIIDYCVAAMPPEQVDEIVGPTAHWPVMDRNQMARGCRIEVIGTGNNKAARRQNVENWSAAMNAVATALQAKQAAAALGYDFNAERAVGAILAELDIRDPVDEILRPLPPMAPAVPPGGGAGGGQAKGGAELAGGAAAAPMGAPLPPGSGEPGSVPA